MTPERKTRSTLLWEKADLEPHGEIGQFLCRLSLVDGKELWAVMRPYSKYPGYGSIEVPLFDKDLPNFAQENCRALGLNPNKPSGEQAWWVLKIEDGERKADFLCITNISRSRQDGLTRKKLAFIRETTETKRTSDSRDSHLYLEKYIDSALRLAEQFTHAFPDLQIAPSPPEK